MDDPWIERVLQMNAAIVAAEARLNTQVIALVETAERHQDTTEAEALLVTCRRSLNLLRKMQAALLGGPKGEV